MPRTLTVVVLAVLLAAPAWAADAPAADRKKLIEFGWDEPDTTFMRQNAAELEASPFDGCVFHAHYTKPDGGRGDFMWECWGQRTFTYEELRPALDDLKAAKLTRFKENFFRFNVVPGGVDWFDDFAPIVSNARLAARFAREGGCPGVLFDIEQYQQPLFNYAKLRDAGTKSFEQYAAQARQRGREVMTAFQEGYPGVTVLLTYGYCLPHVQLAGQDPAKLSTIDYGLLAPFLDGMVDAAAPDTKLIDGYEVSYPYKAPAQFAAGYETVRKGVLPLVADDEKYAKVFHAAFAVWLDYDWRSRGWNDQDPSKNYFTPESFATAVRAALERSDGYAWVYTETPRWWSPEGKPVKLPKAYDEALRQAVRDANAGASGTAPAGRG